MWMYPWVQLLKQRGTLSIREQSWCATAPGALHSWQLAPFKGFRTVYPQPEHLLCRPPRPWLISISFVFSTQERNSGSSTVLPAYTNQPEAPALQKELSLPGTESLSRDLHLPTTKAYSLLPHLTQ